ncbi:hypothetical protein HG530_003271 [Fusarium avenaceum]|nr:hypothetical protein HG530_003271 [Fusarium avenaceum]
MQGSCHLNGAGPGNLADPPAHGQWTSLTSQDFSRPQCVWAAKIALRLGSGSNLRSLLELKLQKSFSDVVNSVTLGLDLLGSLLNVELLVCPKRLLDVVLFTNTDETTLGSPVGGSLDAETVPDFINGLDKLVAVLLHVARGRCNAQTLLANGDSGVVDRLDVDSIIVQEHIGSCLRSLGIADQDRDDVRGVGDDRNIAGIHGLLHSAGVQLLKSSISIVVHLVLNGSLGTSHSGRGQRSGKNEARSQRSDHVNELGATGDVATNAAIRLAQSTSDDVNSVHDGSARRTVGMGLPVKVLSDTSTLGAVHTDSMDFIEKGDGAVLLSKITDFFDRTNRTAHTID